MNYSRAIREEIEKLPENELIIIRELYCDKFPMIPEATFLKCIDRECKTKVLRRLARGIYYKPARGRFGEMPMSDRTIISFFTGGERSGMCLGYDLYNKYALSTQIPKTNLVLSNKVREEKRKIGNVYVKKLDLSFTEGVVKHIEFMEILEHCQVIEDLNADMFFKYVESAKDYYEDEVFDAAIRKFKIKKRTIYFLKTILDYYNVQNNLDKYLTATSNYALPEIGRKYETTRK